MRYGGRRICEVGCLGRRIFLKTDLITPSPEWRDVSLFSLTRRTLDRATSLPESSLAILIQEGQVDKEDIPEIMGRINMTQPKQALRFV